MARLFPMGPSALVSQTFNTSQSFVIPVGVTNLKTVSGQGEHGSAYTWATETLDMMNTAYLGSLGSGTAVKTRNEAYNAGVTEANKFSGTIYGNNIREVSYTEYTYACYSDGNTTVFSTPQTVTVFGAAVTNYATGPGNISPSNAGTDYVRVDVQVNQGSTTGANSSGFGKTFSGGVGGLAVASSYSDVAVTPGASYPVTVAPGGYVTIEYYV